ncbi:hypothetical protein [Enterococcus gallinarum]|uniref:hypothetical protein n=1 Tax=Enterococcus gallinarum TaxID=1353 RepID=UPI0015C5570B|nr:hypothetical protein [Enterococcus gallinarum]NQE01832.1 hypothetical protein [Enterococcus gallinarum]
MSDIDKEWKNLLKELLNTDDKSELAMRIAYLITNRDKYLVTPDTKYNVEVITDPVSKKEKTRVTLEFEGRI